MKIDGGPYGNEMRRLRIIAWTRRVANIGSRIYAHFKNQLN
ncbi:hypothetical protein [Rhizobium leguminosarum]|nr:hypothetical protein [Rhizobium leguminosarum]